MIRRATGFLKKLVTRPSYGVTGHPAGALARGATLSPCVDVAKISCRQRPRLCSDRVLKCRHPAALTRSRLNPGTNAMLKLASALAVLVFSATASLAGAPADTSFCGDATGTPEALLERVKAMPGIKEVHRNKEYAAYQDPVAQTMYTFTLPAQSAHPAVVCRKPIQKSDSLELQMAIVCKGSEKHCTQLEGDFKLLNAKMQADINNQIQANKK